MTTSPKKKTIELQADATVPRGASIKLTVAYRIRPPASTEPGPIYEDVSVEKNVDVNMGANGQYQEHARYNYGNESDYTARDALQTHVGSNNFNEEEETVLVPETIVEHISEDEKSTSSEEVVFEEWSERFKCRRTDEFDPNTKKLIRSTIDETSDRVKGDVIKEEYKGKNVRIKGHKSYDVVKQVHRRVPASTLVSRDQVQKHTREEISPSPPVLPRPILKQSTTTTTSSPPQNQPWASEEVYESVITQDSRSANQADYDRQQQNHFRPARYSPVSPTNRATVSTADYNRVIETVPPTVSHTKTVKEDRVSEEYHVEFETINSRDDHSDSMSAATRTSNWRNELRDKYSSNSSDTQVDQYAQSNNANCLAQRISIFPSNAQQRVKEVQIKVSAQHRTPPSQRKFEPSPSSRHAVKEVLVRISRSSSPEKQYHRSLIDDYEEDRNRNEPIADYETPIRPFPTSATDDGRVHPPKRSSSSSSVLDDRRTVLNQTDQPTISRVGVLRNTFESTTNGHAKEDSSRYLGTISAGLTEQRRKIFEEQEQANKERTRRPIHEVQPTEQRTESIQRGASIVSDRISRFENVDSKPPTRMQSTERLGRTGFDAIKLSLETTASQSPPQTSVDTRTNNKQVFSSIDSDFGGASQPIYHSTPKAVKQNYDDDRGHESEDELSDPKAALESRRRASKARLRDFSQSISPSMETSHIIERSSTRFNEASMENMLSHVPASRGKGVMIELAPDTYQSPTRSTYERNKSNVTADSGVFDRTGTSYQLPTSSVSFRNNVSTSINDDGLRTHDNSVYIATTATGSGLPYTRRQVSDLDDSPLRSTYRHDTERLPAEPINQQQQQQRTARRQITHSTPSDYENPSIYRSGHDMHSKVPVTTQSRSVRPLVVDEIETIETETQVECQVQRKRETNESTRTEPSSSPLGSPQRTRPTYDTTDEKTPSKRVLIQEQPQYYGPPRSSEEESIRSVRANVPTYASSSHPMQVTTLSTQTQVTFEQNPSNEIIATIRFPEMNAVKTSPPSMIRQGAHDLERHGRIRSEDELHQRSHSTNYRASPVIQGYQHQVRARVGPTEPTNNRSSPITYSIRPTFHQSTSHDQNQQQKKRSFSPNPDLTLRSHTQYRSRSLDNLDFEIQIEKRPPQRPEQPTVVSLDQSSRAVVTTSKDGRVCVQNIAARPGNTVVIHSDFHASDRSLNRSSGYFSSDELRSQGHNTNYSSDEQSSGANLNSFSPSPRRSRQQSNDQVYHFDQVNGLVHRFAHPSSNSVSFNDTIDQIDALYNNLDIQINSRSYDFSKQPATTNRRRQLELNPNEYNQRFTSTGFQQIPADQQASSTANPNNNNNNNATTQKYTATASLNNFVTSIPLRPPQSSASSGVLADYGTSGSMSPNSAYGSIPNMTTHQNRLNGQSQIVHRNRASVKQVKQKNAARKRNGNAPEPYTDDDDDSALWANDHAQQRPHSSSRSYNYDHH